MTVPEVLKEKEAKEEAVVEPQVEAESQKEEVITQQASESNPVLEDTKEIENKEPEQVVIKDKP